MQKLAGGLWSQILIKRFNAAAPNSGAAGLFYYLSQGKEQAMKILRKVKSGFAFIWRNNRGFTITTCILLVFLIVLNVVSTQVLLVRNTFNTLFGEERRVLLEGDPSEAQHYTRSEGITSKEEALKAANKLNEEICEEGFVLLKNENALPLAGNEKISVFGLNSVDLVYGGSGSAAKDNADSVDLYKSLDNAGISYNQELKNFYEQQHKTGKGRSNNPSMGDIPTGLSTGELPLSVYQDGSPLSYVGDYSDTALVVISRIGGEGYDLPRTMTDIEGADPESHYLELDLNEKALLNEVCKTDSPFSKVVLIINCATSMELGFLNDPTYEEKLAGAIWVGTTGGTGMNALGRILKGEINPSGRLVDTFAKDFTSAPSWNNFSNNFSEDGNVYQVNGANQDARFVDYEEGIYVGYRYYETRGFTESEKSGNYDWYDQTVMYPFGYGLSYSEFEWTLGAVRIGMDTESASELKNGQKLSLADKDKRIYVDVTVKNSDSSKYSGKDVVQLYYTAPYTAGEIEKAHVILGGFAKTKELAPGESQTVTIEMKLSDMSSYDYADQNNNGTRTYEADAGVYTLHIGKNANHAWRDSKLMVSCELEEDLIYSEDSATGTTIENRFDSVSEHITTYLSRNDWDGTWPQMPTAEERNVDQALIDSMTSASYITADKKIDEGKPWYVEKKPRQARVSLKADETEIKLADMIGAAYDDPKWEKLLTQLTVKEMRLLIGTGNFNTAELEGIEKPKTTDPDGPAGFTNFMTVTADTAVVYDTCFYASECVIAATWNEELAERMGIAAGDESLIGNERGDGRTYSGWYAPAVNIHRTPFSGRNWEYYSEDGLLSGKMAAGVIRGAKSKGVYTYVKHFAVNDQETDRDKFGLITWLNEQAMREIYLKPFELAVKEGESNSIMSSFNRIGTVWAGGCYELLTEILRNEWGFKGMVITDYNTNAYMDPDQMIRAGGDLNLIQDKQPSSSGDTYTASHIQALRNATKNILYTVANSNAMNGMGNGIRYGYAMPYWMMVLYGLDVISAVLICVWGVFSVRKSRKKINTKE